MPRFKLHPPLSAAVLSAFLIAIGCGSETGVPAGADFSDPSKPVNGAKPTEPKSATGPASSEAEGRAALESITKRGRP